MAEPTTEAHARWLAGPEAAALLLAGRGYADEPHRLIRWARTQVTAERASQLATQIALRTRAAAKFSVADQMLLTDVGMQQSTDHVVARYKAGRFRNAECLVDLCCGIGGDLMALGERHAVLGVDRSPVAAVFAQANAAAAGVAECEVRCEDAAAAPVVAALAGCGAWHADPDRRATGRRVVQAAGLSPGVAALDELHAVNPHGAIKLAPATPPPAAWAADRELQWINWRARW